VPALLIVNADDLGQDDRTTAAILNCFRAGAVTSASAMVHMAGSAKAAAAAREACLPVGLHLNLTQPFDDPRTPEAVRDRQDRLVRYFAAMPAAHWIYNPLVLQRIEHAVSDQVSAFTALYDAAPAHVDGHEHIEWCPNVWLSRAVRTATTLRRSYTFTRAEKSFANRAFRAALNAGITRRYRSTDAFVDIRQLHPRLGGGGLAERLAMAERASVEVMVHPGVADEYEVLTDPAWVAALAPLPLGGWDAV
jgi:predicted glycoside hydrolase/deacetylase ChbG (UPF0249 family)